MRNLPECLGVYCTMRCVALILLCCCPALAQAPKQEPIEAALTAAQRGNGGSAGDAAAARNQARSLLQQVPVDEPRFSMWAQSVSQLYRNQGWNAQARAVLQEALDRTGALPDSASSRLMILRALGEAWRQDGNLLKAVPYFERTAAEESAASRATGAPGPKGMRPALLLGPNSRFGGVYYGNPVSAYLQLASLYRQLGWTDSVQATAEKVRSIGGNDPFALAQFYEQFGAADEAVNAYRKIAEDASAPDQKAAALESLASFYARHQNSADAAATQQQAIAALQLSGKNNTAYRLTWMRQTLASYLQRAGQAGQAEAFYQEAMRTAESTPIESQMVTNYARFLAETNRGTQGESVLNTYLSEHADLNDGQRVGVLYTLADLARRRGDKSAADRYQQSAQAAQPPPPAVSSGIADAVEKANTAIRQHRFDDAFTLALQAVDIASSAPDGRQAIWSIPAIANSLASNKQLDRAEQLYERLLSLGEMWSQQGIQPMTSMLQGYANYVMAHRDRINDVPAVIERYRNALIAADGTDTANVLEAVRMKINFQRSHTSADAVTSAEELLRLQESFSGDTSEPYMNDLEFAATVFTAAGEAERALPLRRKAVAIADRFGGPGTNDSRRGWTRMSLANTLAQLKRFDEAEGLAAEAVALQKDLAPQLDQIRRMKAQASSVAASGQ